MRHYQKSEAGVAKWFQKANQTVSRGFRKTFEHIGHTIRRVAGPAAIKRSLEKVDTLAKRVKM